MGIRAVTRDAVLQTLGEHDALGPDEFHARYGYDTVGSSVLVHHDRVYNASAILGVAHRYTAGRPLLSSELSFAEQAVAQELEQLGFQVRVPLAMEPLPKKPSFSGGSASGWSFLVMGEAREFMGHDGYDDVLDQSYVYDDNVSNHGGPSTGDIVVIRTSDEALGLGIIQHIDIEKNVPKKRLRCPNCKGTSFKERKTRTPRNWCSPCQTAFDQPEEEGIKVTMYQAHYGRTWRPLEGCLDSTDLEPMYVSKSKQNAIRRLVPDRLAESLAARGIVLAPAPAEPRALPDSPSIRGGQKHSLVAVREGQAAFRRPLIRRYGHLCAVSGPAPVEALEAAHLRAFAQFKEHRVEDGMLLRADIHRLFDRGLIAVDPNTMTICVSPSLAGYPDYATMHGQRLSIPATHYPSPLSLAAHYQQSSASW